MLHVQSYFYDYNIFLTGPCIEPTYKFLTFLLMLLSLNPQLWISTIIHYTLKLTLPLEGAISFISTIVFRGLNTLIIPKFFNVTFIN